MYKYSHPTQKGILWLESLLKHRISSEIKLKLEKYNSHKWLLIIPGSLNKIIIEHKSFFYDIDSSKNMPCEKVCIENSFYKTNFKYLYAPGYIFRGSQIIEKIENDLIINYDILGLTYYMFCRIEELGAKPSMYDFHDRFPAINSHAYKNKYLDEPIVDQWLNFLKHAFIYFFEGIKIKKNEFQVCPTHDIDRPAKFNLLAKRNIIKNFLKDIYSDQPYAEKLNIIETYKKSRFDFADYLNSQDIYDTFNWILKEHKENNLIGEFYFMAQNVFHWRYDTGYKINNPCIKKLIKFIHDQGHIIGFHPGYSTYLNQKKFSVEADLFIKACKQVGVKQKEYGGRMHYLRIKWPSTIHFWEKAKFQYDSSMGYSDIPGFRCGTCFDYQIYDHLNDRLLAIVEKPLVFMDSSIFKDKYLNLGIEEKTFKYILNLKEKCKEVEGKFTFLWHNCRLYNQEYKNFFRILLSK